MVVLRTFVFFVFASAALAEPECPHKEGLYCPIVQPPRVTSLKEGTVWLSYTVLPDGSVGSIEILEATGDPRWIDAVKSTVQRWQYKKSEKEHKQQFVYHATFAP